MIKWHNSTADGASHLSVIFTVQHRITLLLGKTNPQKKLDILLLS
jgi:hypothetical protein